MLNNIVDNYEQCGQHNIVASSVFNNLEQMIIFRRVRDICTLPFGKGEFLFLNVVVCEFSFYLLFIYYLVNFHINIGAFLF